MGPRRGKRERGEGERARVGRWACVPCLHKTATWLSLVFSMSHGITFQQHDMTRIPYNWWQFFFSCYISFQFLYNWTSENSCVAPGRFDISCDKPIMIRLMIRFHIRFFPQNTIFCHIKGTLLYSMHWPSEISWGMQIFNPIKTSRLIGSYKQ